MGAAIVPGPKRRVEVAARAGDPGAGHPDTPPMTRRPARMPNRKVQVTLSKCDYEAVLRAAERAGGSVASMVREAVREYWVRPDRKRKKLAALDALREYAESADPEDLLPAPEDWEAWEREYGAMKAGRNCGMAAEEFEPVAEPTDEGSRNE